MTIKYYPELVQGSDDWFQARCGLLTASEMHLIISPKDLLAANNDKCRAHLYELLAQRITQYVEPMYIGDEMLRGIEDEVTAKILYAEKYNLVQDMGFITNDKWGFTLGWSPDGLVKDKKKSGAIECKSRRQKFQVKTIIDGATPAEHIIQVQTGMMVGELDFMDFITYSAGLPMYTVRVEPDAALQGAIVTAAAIFEKNLNDERKIFDERIADKTQRLIPTERKPPEEEITV